MNTRNSLLFVIISLFAWGCASQDAQYVDPNGRNLIVSHDTINIQDWNVAADKLVNSMLMSRRLSQVPHPPAKIKLYRILNKTSNPIDTEYFTGYIYKKLINSGVAQPIRDGEQLSATRRDLAYLGESIDHKSNIMDFELRGMIQENISRASDARQSDFIFQLELIDARTSRVVWIENEIIIKRGTRGTVGF